MLTAYWQFLASVLSKWPHAARQYSQWRSSFFFISELALICKWVLNISFWMAPYLSLSANYADAADWFLLNCSLTFPHRKMIQLKTSLTFLFLNWAEIFSLSRRHREYLYHSFSSGVVLSVDLWKRWELCYHKRHNLILYALSLTFLFLIVQ